MTMRRISVILVSYILSQVASDEIKVECDEFYDFDPKMSRSPPSSLAGLRVERVKVGDNHMLNITWAINIDGSLASLTGTHIKISGEPPYLCEYKPCLVDANLTQSQQKWFHFLVEETYGLIIIQAANLPLPPLGSGPSYKFVSLEISEPVTPRQAIEVTTAPEVIPEPITLGLTIQDITLIFFGGLAGVMILSSCYIVYKILGSRSATSMGFQNLHGPMVQVPVLVVYPAGSSAFQQAVVALAEFLQWHGGCSMTLDLWQQGKIAELGPLRWLAEQVKAADRVLIVSPQRETPSHCIPKHGFPEPSIPAANQDLYPLVLNMVASLAKSTSDLSKFWVVHLGTQQDTRSCVLKACKSVYLMKDLKKLCVSLHAQKPRGKRIVDLIFKPRVTYSEHSTVKLKEAVEKLKKHQFNISPAKLPLESVLTVD